MPHSPSAAFMLRAISTAALAGAGATAAGADGPALTVDVLADRHPIATAIYGAAYPDPGLAKEVRIPLQRWGGDATTRYNWQVDATNSGDDWFFMTSGNGHPVPGAGADAMIESARAHGGRALITVPIIPWVNRATGTDCTFPVSLFGPQEKVNPYVQPTIDGMQTDAGNGRGRDGKPLILTEQQIARLHVANTVDLQRGWIAHLVERFGTAAHGGVPLYELDNEPGGWANTHRDVHPGQTGHDELAGRSIAYAAAIKAVDPTAQIVGPGDFVMHYQSDGAPGDGKTEHGGLGQGTYYLQRFAAYEQAHGVRLLDFFDEHYYPADQDGQNEETILEATRSLWDPTYVEKNWIGKYAGGAKALIPKLKGWVRESYPGTRVSLSEYGYGDPKTVIGALADADVFGIFGREGLDMACMFGLPKVDEPAANAFRIYLDYDGHGATYGDTWVRSSSTDQGRISVYGAQRSADQVLTVVVINKTREQLTSRVGVRGAVTGEAQVFRFSGENPQAVVAQPGQAVAADGFVATFPARSITLFAIPTK